MGKVFLTLHSCLVRREDAGGSAWRRADVEVELDILLQPEAMFVTSGKDGLLVLLSAATASQKNRDN